MEKPIVVLDHNGYIRFIGGKCKAKDFSRQIAALKRLVEEGDLK